MSSRKTRKRNKEIRDRQPTITLKESMERGDISVNDFEELNLVGGLTGRKKNNWWNRMDKLNSNPN